MAHSLTHLRQQQSTTYRIAVVAQLLLSVKSLLCAGCRCHSGRLVAFGCCGTEPSETARRSPHENSRPTKLPGSCAYCLQDTSRPHQGYNYQTKSSPSLSISCESSSSIKAALAAKPTTAPGFSESLCMYPRPEPLEDPRRIGWRQMQVDVSKLCRMDGQWIDLDVSILDVDGTGWSELDASWMFWMRCNIPDGFICEDKELFAWIAVGTTPQAMVTTRMPSLA